MKKKCLYKESDAVPVMRNFLSALAYLHQNSIVHRDLKPQNLIFASKTDNEDIKIVDFGFAVKLSNPEQTLIRACGSPGYVSPELLRFEGYNCATDVFSAGVIFAEMLTGLPVF